MNTPFTFNPIGFIRTPHTAKYTAPHQPLAHGDVQTGEIVLNPHCNYEQALTDLIGFERIWVVWVFHRVTGWKTKVLTPRHAIKRSVFATRSPHRPNPIGISVAEVVSIKGLVITISGTDMLDGTPVLDIKPYIPQHDSFPNSAIGWLASVEQQEPITVEWLPLAKAQADWLLEQFSITLHTTITAKLGYHPLPTSYNRVEAIGNDSYTIAYRTWRIDYCFQNNQTITILRIRSCYTAQQLQHAQPTDDDISQHHGFHRIWGE